VAPERLSIKYGDYKYYKAMQAYGASRDRYWILGPGFWENMNIERAMSYELRK